LVSVPTVRIVSKLLVTVCLCALAQSAQAFNVFACEPEWAALTQALYPQAQVFSATTHLQDPHHIEARPSLIARLRQADLAICTGASLEAGWLPMLQQKSANAKVQNGQAGMFYAADAVTLINQYSGTITPFSGDVHPEGNPHFHLDPKRLLLVAAALQQRLRALNPDASAEIFENYIKFEQDLKTKIPLWEARAKLLKGKRVVTQHSSFDYLWQWLQLQKVADLEPKPGMAPTPGHLERTRQELKQSSADAIVIAQHHDKRPAQWLLRQDDSHTMSLVVLPGTVTEVSPDALILWLESLVASLTEQLD